ncbi:type II secretion system protein [Halomicrobium mukohataei]|uniref:Type II secretion system protein n=1 Tax=Halomicrobium mukohataei TaxID=57705 RepID=A0A847UC91_9EURY|nr:type II secretion system F family protein [Halomicrobium mukohataei]NLV11045.1 type II secretion system protein [Halomicrobium mukohataei]
MQLNPLGTLPVFVVIAILCVVALAMLDETFDTSLTRFSRRLFGRYVPASEERERLLKSAFVVSTYRTYAARTLLYTALSALGGAITGVYLFGGLLLAIPGIVDLMMGLPRTMVNALGIRGFELVLTQREILLILLSGGVLTGVTAAGLTYWLRWELPRSRAAVRQRAIDEGQGRTLAFLYALSRGGVSFPKALRTLSDNREIYGASAEEVSVAVRQMDLFGQDMITAVRGMAGRTPSEDFQTFAENLASVLQSGRSLSTFLREQYERTKDESERRQEEILEHLATVAEAYVTVLVAAVLFFITILLVFGLTLTDTLVFIQMVGYLMIPLANAGFMLYLGQRLAILGIGNNKTTSLLDRRATTTFAKPTDSGGSTATDGGYADSIERRQLAVYDRIATVKRLVTSPVETFLWNPSRVLYVTVPVAVLAIVLRAPAAFETGTVNLRVLDDVLIQSLLFVLATFAVARELYTRRIRRIEAATPELLERLASLNEAGMTVVESLERVRGTDVGALSEEVDRIWADVTMGANVEDALTRFGRRIRTTSMSRVVTLLINAMRSSGKMGPILRIAADQARSDHRLRRQRRQEMLTYLVVIYISFLVFLVIIASVQEVLVPALPSSVPTPENTGRLGVNVDQFARLGQVDKAAYTLVFFHTALIQALFTGFVGGQLGEGSLRDGAKHAAIMLGVAYVVFLLLSSPVASLTVDSPAAGQERITVDSASLSDGGYVVVYEDEAGGEIVGQSAYLVAGTHEDVTIELDSPVERRDSLVVVAHLDTDGDRVLNYGGFERDRPYPAPGQGEFVTVPVTVE